MNSVDGDTLTLSFYRDGGYNGQPCPPDAPWMCQIGPNPVEGIAGSGPTPLAAMANLVENIGKFEGCRTDNAMILLR